MFEFYKTQTADWPRRFYKPKVLTAEEIEFIDEHADFDAWRELLAEFEICNVQGPMQVGAKSYSTFDQPASGALRAQELARDAVVLASEGRLNEALARCYEALQLDPGDAGILTRMGEDLSRRGLAQEALLTYRRALQVCPDSVMAHIGIAEVLSRNRDYEKALGSLRVAAALGHEQVEAQVRIGDLLDDWGRTDEAIACFTRALNMRPDYVQAHVRLNDLRRKRSGPSAA